MENQTVLACRSRKVIRTKAMTLGASSGELEDPMLLRRLIRMPQFLMALWLICCGNIDQSRVLWPDIWEKILVLPRSGTAVPSPTESESEYKGEQAS